jgi:hypothetical protein
MAGTKMLLVGLAAAGVVAGSAAASMPVLTVSIHARLAPVAGASAAGHFSGLLVKPGQPVGAEPSPTPRVGNKWRLSWKVNLPALRSPAKASLRIPARNGAPLYVHVLCSSCTSTVTGRLALTNSQALRLAQSHGAVVVLAPSMTLRGNVKAQAIKPKPQG